VSCERAELETVLRRLVAMIATMGATHAECQVLIVEADNQLELEKQVDV